MLKRPSISLNQSAPLLKEFGISGRVTKLGQLRAVFTSTQAKVTRLMKSGHDRGRLAFSRNYSKLGGQTLRIFLSSTFRDMNAERQIVMTKYVPALKQICLEKGVSLTVLDLRWGVTKEEASTGQA